MKMKVRLRHAHALLLVILLLLNHSLPAFSHRHSQCKAWLVQSLPTDTPQLPRVAGVLSTGDVFVWLAGNSTRKLDIIAQYWQLLATPNDSRSGDHGYSSEDLNRFGAYHGHNVYKAIQNAADRDVNVRNAVPELKDIDCDNMILQMLAKYENLSGVLDSSALGLLSHSGVYPTFDKEPADLAAGSPNVKNVTLLLGNWFGSGIVHAKVWISDHKDVYIGSANQDWKSLTQVKELGIYLVDCPDIAAEVETYFDNLWKLAFLNASAYTRTVFDQQWQINRKVPCWSYFIDRESRCRSPIPSYLKTRHVSGYPFLSDPHMFEISLKTPSENNSTLPTRSYLSFAPPELLFHKHQSDEQGWVETIKSVGSGGTVRISTMDWLGQSEFSKGTIYWSSLSSAISEVVFSKNATVKLLVSYWAHNIENTGPYLKSLLFSNILCTSSKYNACSGKIAIKFYEVPGYNLTGPAILPNGTRTENTYPSFSRVQHGKYAVSDRRAHIGTSNLLWDYFYTTSGVSFGTYSPEIVDQLQRVFDADWNSPYAVPFQDAQEKLKFSDK